MKTPRLKSIKITDGFWKEKQDKVRSVTVKAVYERFKETDRFAALKCRDSDREKFTPHIFWDSDVFKWIEGVAYITAKEKNPELEAIADEAIADIIANSDENGYFNSHFTVMRRDEKLTHRGEHELYCLGHGIEAAIEYDKATGKDDFLKAVRKYADYVYKRFYVNKDVCFATPGHPEIELALVKLYDYTGDDKYLRLAEFFILGYGCNDKDPLIYKDFNTRYNHDDLKLAEKFIAEGHAVRAMYLMCGAVGVAERTGNKELMNACKKVFDNVTEKRMYITGGIGSSYEGECFTVDYDLPNREAYAETCASIALALFALELLKTETNVKYADTVERVLYNGMLSGISEDGKGFFYENPLETDMTYNNRNTSVVSHAHIADTERREIFGCSCCPPNIVRIIPSVERFAYTYDENTLFIHQFFGGKLNEDGMSVDIDTDYPKSGNIKIKYDIKNRKLAVRIPSWCKVYSFSKEADIKEGYAYFDGCGEINISYKMPVCFIRANANVHADIGRVAIMRGPVVYCGEAIDNDNVLSMQIDTKTLFNTEDGEYYIPSLNGSACIYDNMGALYSEDTGIYKQFPLKLIPFYAHANRGASDMAVWFVKKQ